MPDDLPLCHCPPDVHIDFLLLVQTVVHSYTFVTFRAKMQAKGFKIKPKYYISTC